MNVLVLENGEIRNLDSWMGITCDQNGNMICIELDFLYLSGRLSLKYLPPAFKHCDVSVNNVAGT